MAYKKPNIPAVHFPDFLKAMPDLTGKTFVISGTTSGTGRVASRAIAQKGGRVIMLNRASTRSEQIQNQMGQDFPKGQVTTIECDLQRFTSVRSACEKLHAVCSQEGIDALINNAGTTNFVGHNDLEGLSADHSPVIYAVNVVGPYQMTLAVTPTMKMAGHVAAVNIASIAGVLGSGSSVAYAASKGALNTMTLSLAQALAACRT